MEITSPHELSVLAGQVQLLHSRGGDGLHFHAEDVGHVQLGRLAGQQPLRIASLTGHFIRQRDALRFGGDHVIIFGRTLEQLGSTGLGQLTITEDDKCADRQLIIERTDRQITFAARDRHMIIRLHGYSLFHLHPPSADECIHDENIMASFSALVNQKLIYEAFFIFGTCP